MAYGDLRLPPASCFNGLFMAPPKPSASAARHASCLGSCLVGLPAAVNLLSSSAHGMLKSYAVPASWEDIPGAGPHSAGSSLRLTQVFGSPCFWIIRVLLDLSVGHCSPKLECNTGCCSLKLLSALPATNSNMHRNICQFVSTIPPGARPHTFPPASPPHSRSNHGGQPK